MVMRNIVDCVDQLSQPVRMGIDVAVRRGVGRVPPTRPTGSLPAGRDQMARMSRAAAMRLGTHHNRVDINACGRTRTSGTCSSTCQTQS